MGHTLASIWSEITVLLLRSWGLVVIGVVTGATYLNQPCKIAHQNGA